MGVGLFARALLVSGYVDGLCVVVPHMMTFKHKDVVMRTSRYKGVVHE